MPSRQRSLDDLADVQWFADAVLARSNKIVRDLGRGKLQPIFDVDECDGDVLWELWIDGFAQAMELRPEAWAGLAASGDADVVMALSSMSALIAIARCLIPRFDGAILSLEGKEAIWDRYVTGAPRPRTLSEQQYSDRKLRSRR